MKALMTPTPDDLQTIREIVRAENVALAEAVADCMATLVTPLVDRLAECEKSLGLVIDGQAYVERLVAHLEAKPEPGRYPGQQGRRAGARSHRVEGRPDHDVDPDR